MSTEAEKQDANVNPVEVAQEAAQRRQRVKATATYPSSPGAMPRVKAGDAVDSAKAEKKKAPAKKATAKK